MSEHLKPGDFIKLNTPTGLKTWYVTGVHLGALHQQSVVTISPFIKTDADIYGKKVQELQVPMEFIDLQARNKRLEKALENVINRYTMNDYTYTGSDSRSEAIKEAKAVLEEGKK